MFQEFKTLFPYLKKYRLAYVTGVLFLLLTDVGQLVIPQFMRRAVDLIVDGGSSDAVGRLMLILVGLAVLVALGRYGWRNFIIGSARRLEADLRADLYHKFLTLSGSFYGRHKVGDLMARATHDMQSIRMATGMALIAFVDGLFMAMALLLILFIGYGKLGLLVAIPLPLITTMAMILGSIIGPLFKRVQEKFANISRHVQETLSGIRVIKSFVKENRFLNMFRNVNTEYGKANMALIRFWGLLFPLMGFLAGLMVLLLLSFGGVRVLDGRLSPGEFVAVLAYLGMLLWPAMGAGWVVTMLQRGAASMKRINEIMKEVPDILDLPNAVDRRADDDIEFKNLVFSYKDDQPVLKDLSLTIPKGSFTGLLGRTGSGKTTLVKILPRLLDPPPGTVFIKGLDIRTQKLGSLRRRVAVVPQDVFLFSESIRDNITFARPDAENKEIEAVLDAAGLRKDLALFSNGLDTQVGEKGVTLSGGQKQRIAIARALLAESDVLLLDDALSAVDAETEETILEALFELRKGCTTLMISHRASTLSRCDHIFVLEEGRISAEGDHDQLYAGGGFYREIADLQRMEEDIA